MPAEKNKKPQGGLSLAEIAAAVEKDNKGQMDVQRRLAASDETVAYEMIAVALYRGMRRRGVDHVKALKSTEELIFITDIKVVIR